MKSHLWMRGAYLARQTGGPHTFIGHAAGTPVTLKDEPMWSMNSQVARYIASIPGTCLGAWRSELDAT